MSTAPWWWAIMSRRKSRSKRVPLVAFSCAISCLREHALHLHVAVLAVVVVRGVLPGPGHLDLARLQPRAQGEHLGALGALDPPGQRPHPGAGRPLRRERRHLECLRVVRHHHLHEGDVGVVPVGRLRHVVGPDGLGLLTRPPGLEDRAVPGVVEARGPPARRRRRRRHCSHRGAARRGRARRSVRRRWRGVRVSFDVRCTERLLGFSMSESRKPCFTFNRSTRYDRD